MNNKCIASYSTSLNKYSNVLKFFHGFVLLMRRAAARVSRNTSSDSMIVIPAF